MAKSNYNGLNQWSGRIGGLVYKVVNGKQVISPYQRKVFNPQSDAQMENRTRFSLASMINKITPKEILQGICDDRRKRRSLFFSQIMRHTVVVKTEEGYTATLNAEDLVFALGEYAPITVSEVTVVDGLVYATISKMPGSVDAVMVIAVVYDTNIGLYTHMVYDILPAGETSICLDTEVTAAGNVAHLYAVPMSLTQLGRSLSGSSDGAERSANNGFSYTLMMRSNEGAYSYSHSQFLATIELSDGTEIPEGGENGGGNENENQNENSQNTQTETVEAPTISGNTSFTDTTEVTITGPAEAEIHYTTDGSTPTSESSLYSSVLTLSETTTVKAIAIKNGVSSTVSSKTFTKGSGGGSGLGDTN